MNFTEVIEFTERLVLWAEIPKEDVKRIFEEHKKIPKNDAMEEDNSYTCGELQFNYDENGENLESVLLFPTYEVEEDSLVNGDFIDVTDQFSKESANALEYLNNELGAER